jgi:hypothetical protein
MPKAWYESKGKLGSLLVVISGIAGLIFKPELYPQWLSQIFLGFALYGIRDAIEEE